jgi:hypothetical protein
MRPFRFRFPLVSCRLLLTLVMSTGWITDLPAQYYTEHFDDVPALFNNGWAQQNRSANPGSVPNWFQGDPGNFNAFDGGDTAYIAVSYNCGTGSNVLSNWLFTPTRTFTNGEKFSFRTRTVNTPNYPDRLQVRLSLNGASTNVGTTATSVGDFTTQLLQINPTLTTSGYPNAWTEYTIIISGLTAPTSGRVAFRYYVTNGGSSGANSEYIGIDSVAYYLPPAGDLRMRSIRRMEYTIFPERHQYSGLLYGTFQNFGSTTVTSAYLLVNVLDSSGTPVYSALSPTHANIVPGDNILDSVPAPTGLAPGKYTLQYIAMQSGVDGDHSNDTLYDQFEISPLTYARDNGIAIGHIGIGAYVGGYVGQEFHLNQSDNLDSIWVHVTKGFTGQPIAAVIWDMANDVPNQIVGSTDTLTYLTDSAMSYVLPLHGGHLQLPAGDFVVTMVEFDSTLHVGMSSAAFTNGTTWLSWPTLPMVDWRNVEYFGLPEYKHPQMIRPIFDVCDLVAFPVMTPPSTPGAQDGSANVYVGGGTPPWTYLWSNGSTASNGISGIGLGVYSVTVTDAAGCTTVATVDVMIGNDEPQTPVKFTAYPNPNDGKFRVTAQLGEPTDLTLEIRDILGRLVYAEKMDWVNEFTRDLDLSQQPGGIYQVSLQAADFRRTFKIETIR